MSSNVAVSVQDVRKRFEMYDRPRDRLLQLLSRGRRQYFKEFWALKGVSFDVMRGETFGLLGRNGSGKSTLLQIIAGTLPPSSGQALTHGRLAALLELGSGFNPDFTGRENVYLNGAILGLTKEEVDERFDSIAAFADIGEHLNQPVKTYSSGMYVRLAFAVQACVDPDILIVDEALSVGDEKFQRKCFDHIDRLREGGCSILVVTHSTATVEKFCQRAALLHQGELHGVGDAKEIVDQYHALLYSDERAYVRYLNSAGTTTSQQAEKAEPAANQAGTAAAAAAGADQADAGRCRAMIREWAVLDQSGEAGEAFRSGDRVKIRFSVETFDEIEQMQAGILIRTIEGVSAFGTSTACYDNNRFDVRPGEVITFDFDITLNLCAAAYFVTIAVADVSSRDGMLYLDKRTDVILLKISEVRHRGAGIAALPATVTVT